MRWCTGFTLARGRRKAWRKISEVGVRCWRRRDQTSLRLRGERSCRLLYYVFIGPDEPGDDSQYEYEHCPSGWSGGWVKVERKEEF